MRFPIATALGAGLLLIPLWTSSATAGTVKGSVAYKGKTASFKYVYLIKGPDEVDAARTIRRIILSQTDLAAKLQACSTTSCTTSDVTDGVAVDLDAGPRLNYWLALNGQRVQYSGTYDTAGLKTTANDGGHVAGSLHIDDAAVGGAKIDADLDVTLTKEVKAGR